MALRNLVCVLLVPLVAGCLNNDDDLRLLEGLEQARSAEIYALHPFPLNSNGTPKGSDDSFHSYKILGRATLRPKELPRLLSLVAQGIAANDDMLHGSTTMPSERCEPLERGAAMSCAP